MGKTLLVALLLVACGSENPVGTTGERLSQTPSCAIGASPLCTGTLTTLECDRQIESPATTLCRHMTQPSTQDTVPCVHAVADNASCYRASVSDPLVWCCSIPE